jgi:serine/threonine-protein kinase
MGSLKLGARLGKYSLVAEIARGGMGIVFLAQQEGLAGFKKLVVIKLLKPELAEDEKFCGMFLDEARLAARLNHRNIVQTIEVDHDEDRYFFVMEYLEGRTLHSVNRLKGKEALSIATVLRIICDVLAGLHYAHELADFDGKPLNIVHRDISPRNVFLTYDGQVKLIDFGVAKASGRAQETEAGELKGRVPYMSPEHVSGQPVDRRTDIFSVGVLLREALTKQRVWEDYKEVDILRSLLERKIPPIPDDVDLPQEAREIIEKAMAPNPDDRYKTAHEMRAALERYVGRIDRSGSFPKLGDHISAQYAAQRQHVQSLIEEHMARARSTPPNKQSDELPTLPISAAELSVGTGSGSGPVAKENDSSPSVERHSQPSQASKPSQSSAASAPVFREISIPPPPKPGPLRYVMVGIGFIALVAGLTAAILSTRDAPVATTIEPPSTTTIMTGRPTGRPTESVAPSATYEPPRDVVEVTIRAVPAIAHIWIDDVLVGQGPHTAKYDRNSKHIVRVSAEGYATRVETMTFDSTASMNLVLDKDGGAPTSSSSRPVKPAPKAPVHSPAPEKSVRQVDPEL